MACNQFAYRFLDPQRRRIRVLELLPGTSTPIFSKFVEVSLNDSRIAAFDALSYTWGAPGGTAVIKLDGKDFETSNRLCHILELLRDKDNLIRIWIDAICINQQDSDEKNQQVPLMRGIYRRANTVRVWLDTEIDPFLGPFIKLGTLDDKSGVEDLGADPAFWDPVLKIFENPYWRRVWIQQEITNATDIRLQCQRNEVRTFNIYHFLRIFAEIQLNNFLSSSHLDWAVRHRSIQLPARFGASNPRDLPINGSTLGVDADDDVLKILSSSTKLHCTDDRDRVYGIMFLSKDVGEGDIQVDYSLTTPQVYTEVPTFLVRKYRSLRFLEYASMYIHPKSMPPKDPTPSWVPDWRFPSSRHNGQQRRPLVSSGSEDATGILQTKHQGLILNILGVRIGVIAKSYHEFFEQDELLSLTIFKFTKACLEMGQDAINLGNGGVDASTQSANPPLTRDGVISSPEWEGLVRTLTGADHHTNPDFNHHVYKGSRELIDLCKEGPDEQGFRPGNCKLGTIQNTDDKDKALVSMKLFVTMTWLMTVKHHLVLTLSGGFGLAHKQAKPGDEVWLLPGCESPIVLRPDSGTSKVVGWAYVDGANSWEPLQGYRAMGDLAEGEKIGEYSASRVSLS